MSRVLIIGPNYFNFLPAVEKAFSELGWETDVLPFDNPVHPYTPWMKWRYKLSRHREALQARGRAVFRTEAISRLDAFRPDLVFLLNGDIFEDETLDEIRSGGVKIALWLFDNRERLPRSVTEVGHVDRLFCFEQRDVDWFRAQGWDNVSFLPQACDPDVYRPLEGVAKDIDILFVGNLYGSAKRKETMEAVIRAFPQRCIEVYGLYQPWYKGVLKCWYRPHKDIFKNRTIPPAAVNALYNRARIVLNIHQELQQSGANPRVFEICGSGAYQICDGNDYIRSLFPDGSVGLYDSEQELLTLLGRALEEDPSAQAEAAHRTVYGQHTFVNRMAQVLSSIRSEDSLCR